MDLLLGAGANPNVANAAGRMPLHAAVRVGNVPLVQTLLEAKADPAALTHAGESPLALVEQRLRMGGDRMTAHHAVMQLLR